MEIWRDVKQYPNLIKTLLALLKHGANEKTTLVFGEDQNGAYTVGGETNGFTLPIPCFLMSWRRRLPKEDEAMFFSGCKESGFRVEHLGSRIYCIFMTS